MTESYMESKPGKLRVQFIGKKGISRDILLSIFVLKCFILNDKSIAQSLTGAINRNRNIFLLSCAMFNIRGIYKE
jgi:hypothetical protein